jgi:hypothetical protein
MGLGYASSCLADEWSIFNNVGGLAKVDHPVAACTYDSRPSFAAFNRTAALFAMPTTIGVVGMGIYRFGDNIYNEQILSAAFSNSFGLASLGIKINYLQYHAEGFGNAQAVTVSFGGIARLTQQLSVGAHIININQPMIGLLSKERVPTELILGVGIELSEKTHIATEIEKDLVQDPLWKAGLENKLHKKIAVRCGFNLNPNAIFIGFGFNPKNFMLNYCLEYNMNLGISAQASVTYKIKSQK